MSFGKNPIKYLNNKFIVVDSLTFLLLIYYCMDVKKWKYYVLNKHDYFLKPKNQGGRRQGESEDVDFSRTENEK